MSNKQDIVIKSFWKFSLVDSLFFLNAIYYSQNGTPQLGCNVGLEHYFFLYLGMMAAMITLIFNSYTIFNGIVRIMHGYHLPKMQLQKHLY